MPRRWGPAIGIGAIALVAAAFRVPAFLSTRHLGYDDGVYASSVLLMREGLDPFKDFFSSQGPVFLPLLRVFDATGLGDLRASRLAMVFTGATLATAVYLIASRSHPPVRAAAAALAAASSGMFLIAAGPLQSDGPALAFGLLAVALAAGDVASRRWMAPVAGVLAGLAIATKSLHLLPTVLVALVLVVIKGGRSATTAFVLSGIFTGVLVTWPWGFENVWDQYVVFHFEKGSSIEPLQNIVDLGAIVIEHELPLLVLLATGAALTLARRPPTLMSPGGPAAIPGWVLGAWAVSSLGLLVFAVPLASGFERFGALLVAPLILIAFRTPVPSRLALGFLLVALPYQYLNSPYGSPISPTPSEAQAVEILSDVPDDGFVVTDSPGLAWVAGRLSHPDTVDSSFARIEAGRATAEQVTQAAQDPRTCAYVPWTGRFVSILPDPPATDFDVAYSDGERLVTVSPSCRRR